MSDAKLQKCVFTTVTKGAEKLKLIFIFGIEPYTQIVTLAGCSVPVYFEIILYRWSRCRELPLHSWQPRVWRSRCAEEAANRVFISGVHLRASLDSCSGEGMDCHTVGLDCCLFSGMQE